MKMGQRERGKEGARGGEKGGEEEAQTDHVILPKANRERIAASRLLFRVHGYLIPVFPCQVAYHSSKALTSKLVSQFTIY